MNWELPYGLYPASQFYVLIYVFAFLGHFTAVSYVMGGMFYLSARQMFSRESNDLNLGVGLLVRDWMPFALSVAITLGVAPLLFVQVIYPKNFYTANLLLGWRWMMIIPALIVGFYLLYLMKTRFFEISSRGVRMVILASTTMCFMFVGAGWSSNHVLMELDTSWPHIYYDISTVDTVLPYMLVRMCVWTGGMLMTFPMLIVWQSRWIGLESGEETRRKSGELVRMVRSGAILALIGLGITFHPWMRSEWEQLNDWLLHRVLITSVLSGALYWAYWESVSLIGSGLSRACVMTAVWSVGAVLGGFAREINRIEVIDLEHQQEIIENAAGAGGFWLFVLSVVISGFLIRFCVRMVAHRLKDPVKA